MRNRNTLTNRLRACSVIIPAPNDERKQNQPAQGDENSKGPPPRHNREANDNNFTERQLNSVRRMIQESVATASRDIAAEAAKATVKALQSTNPVTNGISPTSRGITPQNHEEQPEVCLNACPFQDIPASYVKDLQSGEFFNRQSCYLKIF